MGTVLEDFGMKRHFSPIPLYEAILADQDQFENEYDISSLPTLLHTFLHHQIISQTPIKHLITYTTYLSFSSFTTHEYS